jgi:quinolinate synthase
MSARSAQWSLSDWLGAIAELKQQRRAAILVHWYRAADFAEIADVLGDSFTLLSRAPALPHPVLVVVGTVFLAESIKVLCPDKLVLVPDALAGCSLAESCPEELFVRFRQMYPEHVAVVHVQSPLGVKACADVVVTTSTAERVIRQLPPERPVVFAPDHQLGRLVRERTGRQIVSWFGQCVVHVGFSLAHLEALQQRYPEAAVLVSAQAPPEFRARATVVGAAAELVQSIERLREPWVIAVLDHGFVEHLQQRFPEKRFVTVPAESDCRCTRCPYMALNTVPKLYQCLQAGEPAIELPAEAAEAARAPHQRLLELLAQESSVAPTPQAE